MRLEALVLVAASAIAGCGTLVAGEATPDVDNGGSSAPSQGGHASRSRASAPATPTSGSGSPATTSVTTRIVLVSRDTFQGDRLGGVFGANAICNQLATLAGLSGKTFVAWLSDMPNDAAGKRVPEASSTYVRTDGVVVSTNLAGAISSNSDLDHAIDHDEYGDPVSTSDFVWTWTKADGTAGTTCASSTFASQQQQQGPGPSGGTSPPPGTLGKITSDAGDWTEAKIDHVDCGSSGHLYCFEQ